MEQSKLKPARQLRVWWQPKPLEQRFYHRVDTLVEAHKALDLLDSYEHFMMTQGAKKNDESNGGVEEYIDAGGAEAVKWCEWRGKDGEQTIRDFHWKDLAAIDAEYEVAGDLQPRLDQIA
jgi:hypothetical protein